MPVMCGGRFVSAKPFGVGASRLATAAVIVGIGVFEWLIVEEPVASVVRPRRRTSLSQGYDADHKRGQVEELRREGGIERIEEEHHPSREETHGN